MTPDEELIRARQAQEALDNPLINEALDAYEQRITQTWQEATLNGPDAPQNLLRLRMMLDAAKTFRKYLLATVESGKVAEAVIRQERTLAERLKNPFGRR